MDALKELDALDAQIQQLQRIPSVDPGLSWEGLEWKKKAEDREKKIISLESKMRALIEGVKEERSMQQKTFEDLTSKLAEAETQNEVLTEKLNKLVVIAKQQRAQLENSKETQPAKSGQDTQQLSQEMANLKSQLQRSESEKEQYHSQAFELSAKLADIQNDFSRKETDFEEKLGKIQYENSKLVDEAHQYKSDIAELKNRLDEQEKKHKQMTESIHKLQSPSLTEVSLTASSSVDLNSGSKIQVPDDAAAKLNALLAAVKKERTRVKSEMEDMQQKMLEQQRIIEDLQNKHDGSFSKEMVLQQNLDTAERKIAELEEQLSRAKQNSASQDVLAASTNILNELEALADDIPPPPPPEEEDIPPPPPMDDFFVAKPKPATNTMTPKKAALMSPVTNSSSGNIVDELKKGVQLKKTDTTPKPKQTQKPGIDLSSIGAQAMLRAKERQERMLKSNQPRKSVKLTNLLSELDNLTPKSP